MPIKLHTLCPLCGADKTELEQEITTACDICGADFEADTICTQGHHVCHMCRQKAAREAIVEHCLGSSHSQPLPLVLELMQLPSVAMHGPEHHLLLTAALLTAYCNEKQQQDRLPELLAEANERSLGVPGGACGYWGVCGAAVGGGIYMSLLTEADPWAGEAWKASGQLTARCADAISAQGGPRCCKRDSFLALKQAVAASNAALDTHFAMDEGLVCQFYPNNEDCKQKACPFFPAKK